MLIADNVGEKTQDSWREKKTENQVYMYSSLALYQIFNFTRIIKE